MSKNLGNETKHQLWLTFCLEKKPNMFFLFHFLQKTAKFGKIAKKGVSKMVKTLNVFGVSR